MVVAGILDGAAMVQMLNPGTSKTFQEHTDTVFVPYICAQLEKTNPVNILWDVYLADSLKGTTGEKRGKGIRKRVTSSTVVSKNWKDFLHVDDNKTELFNFLSQEAIHLSLADGKDVYATHGREVLCSPEETDLIYLAPYSQEEADTHLFLHWQMLYRRGARR